MCICKLSMDKDMDNKNANQPFLKEKQIQDVPCLLSQRWILAYAAFCGSALTYAIRVNLSVAIVCMVKVPNESLSSTSNSTDLCSNADENVQIFNENAEFEWNKSIRSSLLASFFYGYIVTPIPGGWLADRFGGRRVWGVCMAISAVSTVLIPVCARVSVILVYVLRVIVGLATGVVFPCMQSMWGRWAPPLERSKLVTFTFMGTTFGIVTTFASSGYLCQYGFDNGWGSIFYITGGLIFIWVVAWFVLTRDTPMEHPWISDAEKEYITSVIEYDTSKREHNFPWMEFLKSPALLACACAHFCDNWTKYTLLTSLPAFMKGVLHFNIKNNGVLTSVPYICQGVMSFAAGNIADFLRSRKYLTTRRTRKLIQAISFIGAGTFLVATGFVTCHQRALAVAFLSIAVMATGCSRSAYAVNHVDFAPKYAGILYGITNTCATLPGMIAPIIAGALTPNDTPEEWRNVFYVCAAFCLSGLIVFGCFARGEVQEWAKDKDLNIEMTVKT